MLMTDTYQTGEHDGFRVVYVALVFLILVSRLDPLVPGFRRSVAMKQDRANDDKVRRKDRHRRYMLCVSMSLIVHVCVFNVRKAKNKERSTRGKC
jgi:hypothetical protein